MKEAKMNKDQQEFAASESKVDLAQRYPGFKFIDMHRRREDEESEERPRMPEQDELDEGAVKEQLFGV